MSFRFNSKSHSYKAPMKTLLIFVFLALFSLSLSASAPLFKIEDDDLPYARRRPPCLLARFLFFLPFVCKCNHIVCHNLRIPLHPLTTSKCAYILCHNLTKTRIVEARLFSWQTGQTSNLSLRELGPMMAGQIATHTIRHLCSSPLWFYTALVSFTSQH